MKGNNEVTSHNAAPMPHLTGVQHSFVDLPGLRMHVAEAGQGEPVLLLHGVPQHWWEWRHVIPELAASHRVIAPDLRGAGWTDAPRDGYSHESLFADLENLLDTLAPQPVHIIAHDWSAMLAVHYCLKHPDRVRTFLSMSVPHPYSRAHPALLGLASGAVYQFALLSPFGVRALARGRQPLARYMLQRFAADPGIWSDQEMEPFLGVLREPGHARAVRSLYSRFILPEAGRIFGGRYRNTHLTTPTQVLVGAEDTQVPPQVLQGYEPYADHLSVERVDGAFHWIPDERPDAVVDAAERLFAAA